MTVYKLCQAFDGFLQQGNTWGRLRSLGQGREGEGVGAGVVALLRLPTTPPLPHLQRYRDHEDRGVALLWETAKRARRLIYFPESL